MFSPHDLARLDSYASNMLDYHVILDLLPAIAHLFFTNRLPQVLLSGVQQAILLAIGLQRKDLSGVEKELDVPSSQLLAMFIKVVRKISVALRSILEQHISQDLPTTSNSTPSVAQAANLDSRLAIPAQSTSNGSHPIAVEDDAEDAQARAKQREMINALPLDRYDLNGDESTEAQLNEDARWAEAERQIREGGTSTVSVKGTKKRKVEDEQDKNGEPNAESKKSKKNKERTKVVSKSKKDKIKT